MSSTSPSPSSSTAASTPAATSTSSSSSSSPGASPPIFVGFIGVGVLLLCLVSLCVWRRLIGRNYPFTPGYDPNAARRPQNDNNPANGRPEMFDAWTGERVSDGPKWEESLPFSVTILTGTESDRTSDDAFRRGKAGKYRTNSARGKKKEKEDPGSSDLQVAVLVAMPSPFHTQSHDGVDQKTSGSSLRGELAIGLVEVPCMPWIKRGSSFA
ncbi:hypothetical protein BJY52DRAFT_1246482 [Lactarius psammicola]|nr:hypothetical protein BJY52DRAFT_1246482 [Lactarius psammicola]